MAPPGLALALVLGWAAVAVSIETTAEASTEASRSAGPAPFALRFVAPFEGLPLFGTTEVELESDGVELRRLELFLDGVRVGVATRPPFRFEVDLGQENVERTLTATATSVAGARATATRIVPAIRVDDEIDVPLRQVYVTATRDGVPVLDLGRDEIALVDDGRREALVTFERGDVPLTAALVIDVSRSMRGAPHASAGAGVAAFAAGMAPLDEAALFAFADRLLAHVPFGGEPGRLEQAMAGLAPEGGTALVDHLFLALQALEERQGRRLIVLVSDGVDVESLLGARDLEPLFGRSQALVYWIRLGAGAKVRHRSFWRDFDEHDAEREELERLVARSGGRTIAAPAIEAIPELFAAILEELRQQYVLGYAPSTRAGDGRYRELAVETRRPGVALRSRAGYYDD